MPAAELANFNNQADLQSAPIDPAWIVEGAPAARNCVVAGSTDYSSWTMLWDCTAGKFHWTYKFDETVNILEGSVTVTIGGKSTTLRAGDIAFFPYGAVAHWHVENYVRKIAFCQKPVPGFIGAPLRWSRRLLKHLRKGMVLVEGSLAEQTPSAASSEQMLPSRARLRS